MGIAGDCGRTAFSGYQRNDGECFDFYSTMIGNDKAFNTMSAIDRGLNFELSEAVRIEIDDLSARNFTNLFCLSIANLDGKAGI